MQSSRSPVSTATFFSAPVRILSRSAAHPEDGRLGHLHVVNPVLAEAGSSLRIEGSEATLDSIAQVFTLADAETLGRLSLVMLLRGHTYHPGPEDGLGDLLGGLSLHPDTGPADEAKRHVSPK